MSKSSIPSLGLQTYNQSQSNRRSVNRSILENNRSFHMFPNSPRMLPEGLSPTLHKMHITCGQFEARDTSRRSSKGRRSIAEGRESLVHPGTLGETSYPVARH